LTRFQLTRRGLLLAFFLHLVIPIEIFGNDKFSELCDKELLKNRINFKLAKKYCQKAKENALKIGDVDDISWYLLINGDFDKNINRFKEYKNNLIVYTNMAHSYLLLNNTKKAKEYYTKVLELQSDVDEPLQSDFKLLFKLYPKYHKQLKKGLIIWNNLYKPFIAIDKLYKEYEELKDKGKYDLAIKKLSDIISLKEKTIAKDRLAIMMDYYELALLYEERNIYPKAIDNYKKSLNISEKFLDKNHIHIGTIYNSLGLVLSDNKNFLEAEKSFYKGLDIYKSWFDDNDTEIATFYNNLGTLYKEMRLYPKAEIFFKKAISIYELHHLDDSVDDIYDNLGLTYLKMKKYKLALTYHKKSLEIRKKLGAVQSAISYSVLGSYYQDIEDYLEALNFHKKALDIREKELGKFNIDTSESYHNLGATYDELRDYDRALKFYKKALEVNEKLLDKNDIDIAIVSNNIASIYNEKGNYIEAEKYISKSLKIKEAIFKKNDIELAISYNNRGLIFENMKKYDKALSDYNKSIKIYIDNFTENSKEVAIDYNNIASLYNDKKDYKNALRYLNRAKDILNRVLVNKEDTFIATLYNNLGLIYEYAGDYPNAYKSNSLSFEFFLKNRDKHFLTLDSSQKSKYLKSFGNRIDNLLNSAYLYMPLSKDITSIKRSIFNDWLKFKGTIFASSNILSSIEISSKTNDNIKKDISTLRKLTIKLDDLDSSDIQPKNYEKQKATIDRYTILKLL